MANKLQDRSVRIGLPLENDKYNYFSGYVLADGLVITCYHGFSETENRKYDKAKKIIVCSYKYSIENDCQIEIGFESTSVEGLSDELFSFSLQEEDIVVLRCGDSIQAPLQKLYTQRIKNRDQFDSGGYPTFHRHNAASPSKGYASIYGETSAETDGVNTFVLKDATSSADEHCQWEAVSGGAVLIRGQLAGILKEYREDSGQLFAISMSSLLNSDFEFKAFIEGLGSPKTAYFEKRTYAEVQTYSGVFSATVRDKLKAADDKELAESLLSLERQELLSVFDDLDDKDVGGLVCLLLALSYSNEQISQGKSIDGEELPYIDVPCARQEACELLMAFQAERDPILKIKKKANGTEIISPGRYCINVPPEHGIEGPSSVEISKDLLAGRARTFEIAQRLYMQWNEDSEEEYTEGEEWVEAANLLLDEESGRYYWRLSKKDIQDSKALLEVNGQLPLLKFVKVNGGVEVGNEERKIAKKLKPFLMNTTV